MSEDRTFTPESVDEQVDQLLSLTGDESLLPSARVVQRLHAFYEADKHSTEQVWQRLAQQVNQHESNARQPGVLKRWQHGGTQHMLHLSHLPQQTHKRHSIWQGLNLLAAVFLIAVLVGSLVTVFNLARIRPGLQTGASQGKSTPAPDSIGKLVYSTPLMNGWVVGRVAWSADSQRIATATGNIAGEQIEIWDATTGQHKVTVPLNLDPIASPAWSPASDLLAVPTNNAVVIVNGKTGKIGASYPAPTTGGLSATATIPSTGKTFLTTFIPHGGGPNFGGIAWSPDGKWIVSTFSSFTSNGVVQVWNPQTGKLAFTLATKPDYFMGMVSWSPDGQYIAVNMAKWNASTRQIVVWSVKTRQIVFQQSGNLEGLSWQPGTDNLAAALVIPGSNSSLPGTPTAGTTVLTIWNVPTNRLLKSFSGINGISWSPDGQEFAYANVGDTPSAKTSITILNVTTGQKVYVYQVSAQAAQTISVDAVWSPDGKYIASAEGSQSSTLDKQSYGVKIWVA
jgi:WD40 repeat protein